MLTWNRALHPSATLLPANTFSLEFSTDAFRHWLTGGTWPAASRDSGSCSRANGNTVVSQGLSPLWVLFPLVMGLWGGLSLGVP